jgi:hypothetical protein
MYGGRLEINPFVGQEFIVEVVLDFGHVGGDVGVI